LTIKVNRSIFANQYLEDRPLGHNEVIDTRTLEKLLTITEQAQAIVASQRDEVLDMSCYKWDPGCLERFIMYLTDYAELAIVGQAYDNQSGELDLPEMLSLEALAAMPILDARDLVLDQVEFFEQERSGSMHFCLDEDVKFKMGDYILSYLASVREGRGIPRHPEVRHYISARAVRLPKG